MLAIYGERFSAIWAHSSPDEMKDVWADALGGFNAQTLSIAIKACYDEKYPPNLPEFVALCRRYYQKPQTFSEYREEVADKRVAEIIDAAGKLMVSK